MYNKRKILVKSTALKEILHQLSETVMILPPRSTTSYGVVQCIAQYLKLEQGERKSHTQGLLLVKNLEYTLTILGLHMATLQYIA